MKFAKSILIGGILTLIGSAAIAQTGSAQFDQWYRAKYGRPAPTAQAQPTTSQTSAAPKPATAATTSSFEQWYLAKYGRPATTEQARLDSAQANPAAAAKAATTTADTTSTAAASAQPGFEQWYLAKYGRPAPPQEARNQQASSTCSDCCNGECTSSHKCHNCCDGKHTCCDGSQNGN